MPVNLTLRSTCALLIDECAQVIRSCLSYAIYMMCDAHVGLILPRGAPACGQMALPFLLRHRRFVFDGKAPTLKSDELAKRYSKRQTATTDLETAKEVGTGLCCACQPFPLILRLH